MTKKTQWFWMYGGEEAQEVEKKSREKSKEGCGEWKKTRKVDKLM